jgi:hypothetical protein
MLLGDKKYDFYFFSKRKIYKRGKLKNTRKGVFCELVLGAEFLAAFEAASFQNESAGLGRHAGTEAVHAGAVTSFWLVCSLWHRGLF